MGVLAVPVTRSDRLLVVDLQGRVRDPVGAEHLLDGQAGGVAVDVGPHEHVRRQRGLARGDLPDVQVVHLVDARDRGEVGPDPVGVDAAGAASRKIRPLSRSSAQPALIISPATTSAAMASARAKPVVSTTRPAIAVAMNAYRSLRMCWNAPSTFRLVRSARLTHQWRRR